MKKINTTAGELIQTDLIDDIGGIVHGFGVRGVTQAQYLDALGIEDRYILDTNQIHGKVVHCLMYPKGGSIIEGDAFMTDRPGLVCFVRSADCVPILIADKKNKAVAAVHAGWKGTALNIVDETLKAMNSVYGTEAVDCVAAIGPAICGKCYEVGVEVVEALSKLDINDKWKIDSSHVDLKKANHALLEKLNISEVDVSDSCTFCDSTFNSWRRDHNEDERQFSFIMV
ncbi:MAG: peptidoglycan editing factor PgeF, partial [Deltaproteobacteria bacterium]|nr:peptidoglycan editing factor PgeF [Deltaproteobacteria bacterium]